MKNGIKTLAIWLILIIIFMVGITSIVENNNNKLAYSDLIAKVEANEVKEIEIDSNGTSANVTLTTDSIPKEVNIPSIDSLMDTLQDSMKDGSIKVTEKSESMFLVILSLLEPIGI